MFFQNFVKNFYSTCNQLDLLMKPRCGNGWLKMLLQFDTSIISQSQCYYKHIIIHAHRYVENTQCQGNFNFYTGAFWCFSSWRSMNEINNYNLRVLLVCVFWWVNYIEETGRKGLFCEFTFIDTSSNNKCIRLNNYKN